MTGKSEQQSPHSEKSWLPAGPRTLASQLLSLLTSVSIRLKRENIYSVKAFLLKRAAGIKATGQCCPLVDYNFRRDALKLTKSNDTEPETTLDFAVIDFFLMAAMLPGTKVLFPTLIY